MPPPSSKRTYPLVPYTTRLRSCRFGEAWWDEAEATLSPPPGLDVAAYRRDLMARFANPAWMHRTRQIAMDGSQKLPQRLLATLAARRGQRSPALSLAVAAWQLGRASCRERVCQYV